MNDLIRRAPNSTRPTGLAAPADRGLAAAGRPVVRRPGAVGAAEERRRLGTAQARGVRARWRSRRCDRTPAPPLSGRPGRHHVRRGAVADVDLAGGRICREGDPEWGSGMPVRAESIPVRRGDGSSRCIVQRSTNLSSARTPSRLELTYLQSASDLAQMIARAFPFPGRGARPGPVAAGRRWVGAAGRRGAGRLCEPERAVRIPPAGLAADLVGSHLGETTAPAVPGAGPRRIARGRGRRPQRRGETEIEANGSIVQLRAIPLWPRRAHRGDRPAP